MAREISRWPLGLGSWGDALPLVVRSPLLVPALGHQYPQWEVVLQEQSMVTLPVPSSLFLSCTQLSYHEAN